jgi:tripartite-type tricarboxylate transporter receptor subunit TctC
MPELVAQGFSLLLAPKGTPQSIIQQIAQATRTVLANSTLQQTLVAAGLEPVVDSSPEKAARFLHDEIARWTPVIKSMGLSLS